MPVSRPDNPYHFFLKLPPETATPDHYQLLGLPQFTDDQAAIKSAALERNRELRGWDNSNYHLWSNELLDEVVQAVMTLETPSRKADYDRGLRLKLGLLEAEPASATTTPEPRVSSAPLSDRPVGRLLVDLRRAAKHPRRCGR